MSRKKIFTLTALAFLIVGFTSFLMGQAAPTTVKQAGANASQVGRYQIVSNPNVRADTFLLDTQTGNTNRQYGGSRNAWTTSNNSTNGLLDK
jgi:hypothetical protein